MVGHWQDGDVIAELAGWSRVACAVAESRSLKIVRFGGMNMREVAVTGGDRVEAEIKFGWSINGYAVGDLVERHRRGARRRDRGASSRSTRGSTSSRRRCAGAATSARTCATAARQELGMRAFLTSGGYGAFTTTFEDLLRHEPASWPRLPAPDGRRLRLRGRGRLEDGGARAAHEGHGGRVAKGGVSFMEDYTYHLVKGEERVLGAHMLEVCPSIADGRSRRSRSIRSTSAARPLPAGWSSMRRPGRRSPRHSSTWADGCG